MLSFNQLTGQWVSDNNGNTTIGTSSSANTNPRLPASAAVAQNNSAVGYGALKNNQTGKCNVAIGTNALNTNVGGSNNIAIGANALFNPGTYAEQAGNSNIAIGINALSGNTGGQNNVAVGSATNSNNHDNCILIGNGAVTQDDTEIGLGGLNTRSGTTGSHQHVDKFLQTRLTGGSTGQGTYYIPLFPVANSFEAIPDGTNWGDYLFWAPTGTTGEWQVGNTNITLGQNAGLTGQGANAVAVGHLAGQTGQKDDAVAIGYRSGQIGQGLLTVAIGAGAGLTGQKDGAVAIGAAAGQTGQGLDAVAVGLQAGEFNQGQHAVAIGHLAGATGQHAYSIALNASGIQLNPGNTGFFVRPLRSSAFGAGIGVLVYDPSSYEIMYSTD